MKKRGFTLIELIVVIAIIGVLAAILVPAMMGYIARSKITVANSSAKSLYDAVTASMIEVTTYDLPPKQLVGQFTATGAEIYAMKDYDVPGGVEQAKTGTDAERKQILLNILYARICSYFDDVHKIKDISFLVTGMGKCQGVGVMKGGYPGTQPIAIAVEDYEDYAGDWTSLKALNFAMTGNADDDSESNPAT